MESAKISFQIAATKKRMIGGIGDVLFSIYTQTWKWERSHSFFSAPLKHVMIVRGQILLSRNDDEVNSISGKQV